MRSRADDWGVTAESSGTSGASGTTGGGTPGLVTTIVVVVLLAGVGIFTSVGKDGDDQADATTTTTTTAADEGSTEQVEAHEYVSRPDLTPPVIDVTTSEASESGLVFLAPKGGGAQKSALIVDGEGEPVWVHPTASDDVTVADFRVQTYQGRPVLTWWEGLSVDGHGQGDFVLADAAYNEIRRFPAANGRPGDIHELQLTDRGTALVLSYQAAPADLTAFGGPAEGTIYDNYVQEIDVATGQLVFEWNTRDHVPLTDTYNEIVAERDPDDVTQDDGTQEAPFDAYHLNSVAEYDANTLLVSARNTQAVYAVDRTTGEVRWTLGGKSNDFSMGAGATFHWQHDARRRPDGTISLFDNEGTPATADQSRALVLSVDEANHMASMVSELFHPEPVLAGSQGNTQVLADGQVVVGWGSAGSVTQYLGGDAVVLDSSWSPADSYRVYRMPWTGRPATLPDVVAAPAADTPMVNVYVSWNGATGVTRWQVLAGDDPANLQPVTTVPRDGFETVTAVQPADYVAVQALDASGTVLATSDTVGVLE